jgi:nucleotide-binding universal stress UspA family protein
MSVRRVILGIDGRESSEAALDWAVTETAAVGSVLVVAHATAHVIGALPARRSPGVPGGDRILARALEVARRRLDPDRIQPVLRSGAAGGALVDLAYAEDILVLGAPTHRRWMRPGSTTRYVLGHAPCPVVVVPSRSAVLQRRERLGARGRPGLGFPDHVVVAAHPSRAASAALTFGFAYAARHRLPVAAVHITGQRGDEVWFDEHVKASGRQYPQVAVQRLVIAGEVVPDLVAAAEGATLLVAGGSERGVGPVVRGLVDDCACPVAVVRHH